LKHFVFNGYGSSLSQAKVVFSFRFGKKYIFEAGQTHQNFLEVV